MNLPGWMTFCRRRPLSHMDLVRLIARKFGMPPHVRAFKIEWRVGEAITVTVEHYPWKTAGHGDRVRDLGAALDRFELRPACAEPPVKGVET